MRLTAFLLLFLLLLTWPSAHGARGSQVIPDARGAFGILSAGAKVINPQALQAELTLENGIKLWFAVRAAPDRRVGPSRGSSLANYLSSYYLLAPNTAAKFIGDFPEPGDRVSLSATLNSPDAALLNVEQVLVTAALAMVPGSRAVDPKGLVEALQDFKRVGAIYQASRAFLPPPKTAAGWARATIRAADSLRGVLKDATQRELLLQALRKIGVEIAANDLRQLLSVDNARGLLKIIADEAVFMIATKGREPRVLFERSSTATDGSTPDSERKAILNALRAVVLKKYGKEVIFRVGLLRVSNSWAYMEGNTLNKDGTTIDELPFDLDFGALLRKSRGSWRVLFSGFSGGAGLPETARRKFPDAPRSIFP